MASTMHISPGHNLPDNDSIINSISQVISERVSEWCGENISLASLLPEKLTFRNSFFLRFQLLGFENTTRALLVKIPREQDMVSLEQAVSNQELKEMTKSEFDMLIEVYDVVSKLKSTAFTAIRPLFYLPQWNAIVMEELPSRTLEDLAFDLRTRLKLQPEWGQFKDALYLTGQWMRMYHETLGSWQLAPLKIDDLILEIDQKINLLEPSVIRRVDWNELRAQFRRILDNLRGLSVPYVNLHGDLFLTNVVITPDNRVAVIDLTRMSWGPIYSDLSSVIIELVEQRLKLSSFGFIVREPTILDFITRQDKQCLYADRIGRAKS